ncbi:glycosyltransferase family 39 protein [Candidatus Woesearchaeota archaeon]|nr:glycosyltransferase family 39 protein [Candidatus Woesearchaeota archaeon]
MKLFSRLKNLERYEKYALIAIIIAVIVRFSLAGIYSVSGDACWHLSAARFMADSSKIPLFEPLGRDEPFWAPPLFHIIASFSYLLLGEFGLKIIAPIFGSLALIISYFILRYFLNAKASFYGILFLSFIPISIDYSVLAYTESMLTFFVVLSIYLALRNNFILSGIAAGLAVLTKYNGAFVIPVLMFIAYKNSKNHLRLKNSLILLIIPLIISLPWFIRNWLLLGNPVWPFLNFIFSGFDKLSYSALDLGSIFSLRTYISAYLGFFGIPDGNYNTLNFIGIPYLDLLFAVFLAGTIIFLLPLLFGFRKHKGSSIFYLLLASFLVLFALYVANVGPLVSRMLLPAFIALAFFYGIGVDNIVLRYKKFGYFFIVLMIMVSFGFVIAEYAKFSIASESWNSYQDDFKWARENTEKDAVFMAGGQCMSFYLDRFTLLPKTENIKKADYAFVNQDFRVDKARAMTPEDVLENIRENGNIVYENKETKTEVYAIG